MVVYGGKDGGSDGKKYLLQRGTKKFVEMIYVFITLSVVMVSGVHTYEIIHFKYMQFIVC